MTYQPPFYAGSVVNELAPLPCPHPGGEPCTLYPRHLPQKKSHNARCFAQPAASRIAQCDHRKTSIRSSIQLAQSHGNMQQTPRQHLTVCPLVDGEADRVGLDVPHAKLTILGPGKTDVAFYLKFQIPQHIFHARRLIAGMYITSG